jgi:glycosyltransferase involved in cell wall biosynthesis
MTRVLIIEASSGGVVGGSLTGLLHMIHGLDRNRVAAGLVLYEPKGIDAEMRAAGVPVYQVHRRRLPKEHALLGVEGYRQAKRVGAIRSLLGLGRQALRLVTEELPSALRLARVIREFRADVVHLGNGVRANYDGLLACWLTRTPVICHVKGFEKYAKRERAAARRIDALVPMTRAVEEHCRRAGVVSPRTLVIYDGIADEGFAPTRPPAEIRADLGIGDAPCVGVASNIQEWKGQLVLVEAMAEVVRAVPEAKALIVGGVHRAGVEYNARIERRIAELGLGGSIVFTGFRSDIADVTNALDVVVHTSVRPEPFGRVILEGQLLGKPVVAVAAGGVPELIRDGETGFLFAPGDAQALAAHLIRLLRTPELRRQIGSAAREWARDVFSMHRHVEAFSALYESLTRRD